MLRIQTIVSVYEYKTNSINGHKKWEFILRSSMDNSDQASATIASRAAFLVDKDLVFEVVAESLQFVAVLA